MSGCLSNGQDVASAMQMGADLAYMGTRFINTTEANASDDYKEMIVKSGASDIVYTAAISGVSANFMQKSLENNGITKELWDNKAKIDFGKELDAVQAETKAWKTLWSAGQGVATIHDVLPVNELISQMKDEFKTAIERQTKLLEIYGS